MEQNMRLNEIYHSLFEDKKEYIASSMGPQLVDAYYADTKETKLAHEIVKELANGLPPSDQKPLMWIAVQYCKGNFSISQLNQIKNLLLKFSKVKPKLDKKDIGQYRSVEELKSVVQLISDTRSNRERDQDEKDQLLDNNEAEIIYKSPDATVVKLNSQAASCYFGKGTRWCTTGRENNKFDQYIKHGPLFIIMHRMKKYQLHINYTNPELDPVIVKDDSDRYVSQRIVDYLIDLAPPLRELVNSRLRQTSAIQ